MTDKEAKCVQFGVWSNCCNACQFCLREERIPYNRKKQLHKLERIKENVKVLDWKNDYSFGISLLGGELYYITDKELQDSFLELIDIIIEYILKVSQNPACRYSTVTNGLYNPTFLYKVCDKIVNAVGTEKLDINFSYDLKYRFKNEEDRLLVLKNINEFHKRYNYEVNVQMILTQYLINQYFSGEFSFEKFLNEDIPGNRLSLLYPHPIATGISLPDFNFSRKDFFKFLTNLKNEYPDIYFNFIYSVKNSCSFKLTGLQMPRANPKIDKPKLTNGKEVLNENCGHSILYQCYSDCDKCMLCDLNMFDSEA